MNVNWAWIVSMFVTVIKNLLPHFFGLSVPFQMSLKKVFLTLEQEIHYENVTLVKECNFCSYQSPLKHCDK